jgi:hypothetical protein
MEVVRGVLRAVVEGPAPEPHSVITDDCLIQASSGHVYVGHEGFLEWVGRARAVYRERRFEVTEARELGDGFVVFAGALRNHPWHGEDEREPGAWTVHHSDGRIDSIVYFRTLDDALAAIPSDTPDTRRRVVEQLIAAFNRGDYATVLGATAADLHFSAPEHEGARFSGHFDAADVLAAVSERYDAHTIDGYAITDLGAGHVALELTATTYAGARSSRHRRVWLLRIERGLVRTASYHPTLEAARRAFERRERHGSAPPAPERTAAP